MNEAELVAGSQKWERLFYPRRFLAWTGALRLCGRRVRDSARHRGRTRPPRHPLSWAPAPGDAPVIQFLAVHDGPPNPPVRRRRAFVRRRLGDDVRYVERLGTPSPPYPETGIGLAPGEEMGRNGFPVVRRREQQQPESRS